MHMDPGWSKGRDSLKEGTSSAKDEVSNQEELLRLISIRDFISLLLSYPVKLEEEEILKAWIDAFSEWKEQLFLTDDHAMMDKPWRSLTEQALRWVRGLMPDEIINQVRSCGTGRSIFDYNIDALIPEAILRLTVDLVVEQLIRTLFPGDDCACNMRHVRLSGRNLVEKRSVVKKIELALEDKFDMFGMDKGFHRSLWIDASKYERDAAEVRVQEEINRVMAEVVNKKDEEEMANKRYLVILVDGDNKKLDPRKVCFPAGVVVLITTEQSSYADEGDEFTITGMMDLNIRTQDHLLPWEVFCCYAGISMVPSFRADHQRIAVQIVEVCRGHLLAIVLVAESLKNVEDVKQWELALHNLSYMNPSFDYQESDRIGISRVMVNAFVNIIWEDIEETQRYCLEVSLFVDKIKKGVPVEILMSNCVSASLMSTQERSESISELIERNIRELLVRSVLLQDERNNVCLPIETYDIIKSLHPLNPSIIRHGASELTEPPYTGRWHGLVRIELMDNKICELPESPKCPKLKVLLLQGNVDLMDIPDSFFDHMPLLQYLDLSNTSIRDLPPSISKLTELKTFYLRSCDLFLELPQEIGQLKNLEELDLDGTLITHLPKEIGELIHLQSLTLCFDVYHHLLGHGKKGKQISSSTIIPPGVISSLTWLKYLSISVDPEDDRWNENVVNILKEISGLSRLESLSIHVPEAKLLEFIPARKSLNFRLVVGNYMRRFISRVTPEVEQKFKCCDSSIKFVNGVDVPEGVKMNLERCKALYLDRHMKIKSLSDFELMNLHRLQVCILAECNEMETVVDGSYSDGSYSHDGLALPCLELTVFYMKNLRSICERPLHVNNIPFFLCSLKTIALHTCPMLTTIFSLSFLDSLSLLEELIVEDCPKVTTLISHDSFEHGTNIFLPRLRKIWLLYLPELINIFNGLHVGQSLQEMGFYYCPKLQSLSKTELSSEDLRVIRGESRWRETLKWNEAEWGDTGPPNFFNLIFSPIDVEADLMAQLAADHDIDEDQESAIISAKECLTLARRMSHSPTPNAASLADSSSKFVPVRAKRKRHKTLCDEQGDLRPKENIKQHNQMGFSSGVAQAPFVTSSGLLCRTWRVFSSVSASSHEGNGIFWKVYEEPGSDLTVIAFQVKTGFDLKPDLVSCSELKKKNFNHFEFLCTKKNPDFSVNTSAISLFYENHETLIQLKSQVKSCPRLIVTGHGLGGPIASLFTLSLLDSIAPGKKRPLCITYGSPLIGDKRFQEAISRSSTRNSCFLHVVSLKDPLPRALSPPHTDAYMPFGTFLFCSDISSTCFENPASILEVLAGSIHDQSQGSQPIDYGRIVEDLYRKSIYKDYSAQGQALTHSNSLQASIILQLWAIGFTPPQMQQQQQQSIDIIYLVIKIEALERKFIFHKGKKFDPSRKLSIMKIDMAHLEWYKKDSKKRNIGYYDNFKNMNLLSDQDVARYRERLTLYWNDMVEEAEMNPQSELGAFRGRWLYAGTYYRRMVEPLDIAEYYREDGERFKSGLDYVTYARSRHYKVLEEWLEKYPKKGEEGSKSTSKKNVESILTIDSCFWAHVEEALISCNLLVDVQSSVTDKEEANKKLLEFEDYVYGMLKKYEVSPDIFLRYSSYMTWWTQYKAIKGTTGNQALANFMSKPSHFDQYAKGAYDFP